MRSLILALLVTSGCASAGPHPPDSMSHDAIHGPIGLSGPELNQKFLVNLPSPINSQLGLSSCDGDIEDILWLNEGYSGYHAMLQSGCHRPWLYVAEQSPAGDRIGYWALPPVHVAGGRDIELTPDIPEYALALEVTLSFNDQRAQRLLSRQGIKLALLPSGQNPSMATWRVSSSVAGIATKLELMPGTYDIYLQLPAGRSADGLLYQVFDGIALETSGQLNIPVDVTAVDFMVCESHRRSRLPAGPDTRPLWIHHEEFDSFSASYYASESQTVLLWPGEWTASIETEDGQVVREFNVPETRSIEFRTGPSETGASNSCL